MANSDPETVKLIESPSASVTAAVPIAVWFSAAENVASEVKIGELSFKLLMLTVISWVVELVPSLDVTVAV